MVKGYFSSQTIEKDLEKTSFIIRQCFYADLMFFQV